MIFSSSFFLLLLQIVVVRAKPGNIHGSCRSCGSSTTGDCGVCGTAMISSNSPFCNSRGDKYQYVYWNDYGSCHNCGGRTYESSAWCVCSPTFTGARCEEIIPTSEPTVAPSSFPTTPPTTLPSDLPTTRPTSSPTATPTIQPTISAAPTVSSQPTNQPTGSPTSSPSSSPTKPDCQRNVVQATFKDDAPPCESVSFGYDLLDHVVLGMMILGVSLPVIGILLIDCTHFFSHFHCICLTLLDTLSDFLYLLTTDFANISLFWSCVFCLIWSFLIPLPLLWHQYPRRKIECYDVIVGVIFPVSLFCSVVGLFLGSGYGAYVMIRDVTLFLNPMLEKSYQSYAKSCIHSPFPVALAPDQDYPYRAYYNPLNIIWDAIFLVVIPAPFALLYIFFLASLSVLFYCFVIVTLFLAGLFFLFAFEFRMLSTLQEDDEVKLHYENYEYLVEFVFESLPMFIIQLVNQMALKSSSGVVGKFCFAVTCLKILMTLMHYGGFCLEGRDILLTPSQRHKIRWRRNIPADQFDPQAGL
jgi:hypothetical protein